MKTHSQRERMHIYCILPICQSKKQKATCTLFSLSHFLSEHRSVVLTHRQVFCENRQIQSKQDKDTKKKTATYRNSPHGSRKQNMTLVSCCMKTCFNKSEWRLCWNERLAVCTLVLIQVQYLQSQNRERSSSTCLAINTFHGRHGYMQLCARCVRARACVCLVWGWGAAMFLYLPGVP